MFLSLIFLSSEKVALTRKHLLIEGTVLRFFLSETSEADCRGDRAISGALSGDDRQA
jgi:hypothetical protein